MKLFFLNASVNNKALQKIKMNMHIKYLTQLTFVASFCHFFLFFLLEMQILLVACLFLFGSCHAGEFSQGIFREPGDVMLGFIVAGHENNASMTGPYDYRYACGDLTPTAALLITNFRKIISEVNEQLSGGFSIGYDIIDSCKVPTHAVHIGGQWAVSKVQRITEPDMLPLPPLAVIGAYNSRVTAPVAMSLQYFDIPVVSNFPN